jgi:hypothetical protein
MRPKNVILLEIMILVTNFNDVDLLYYLLFDAFAQRRRVWCTMVAVERRRPPLVSLLVPSSCLSLCVFLWKGFKAIFQRVASVCVCMSS